MKINILLLAAGKGTRFKDYTDIPKPMIPVWGEPMYKYVLRSLHLENAYDLHGVFQESIAPKEEVGMHIHTLDYITDGAASTAYEVINNHHRDEPWLIMEPCKTMVYHLKTKKCHNSTPNCPFSMIFGQK